MNKFEKIYNEYIKQPVLKFDDEDISLYIERESFLYLLEYGKKLEQVLDKIKEIIKNDNSCYNEENLLAIERLLKEIEGGDHR